jgi:hypothetical protein
VSSFPYSITTMRAIRDLQIFLDFDKLISWYLPSGLR